ncbi:TniQ family protein [Pseudokineococcus basanitobsidens]|uniref:TniQ family protein n=1 Tax=Pseudokineococcus basanitobsidens TaxID=1926649 RepID=A0ABU8RQ37_9ACTN
MRPAEGEQVTSWLVRTGHRYDLSPQQLLAAMGVPTTLTRIATVEEHVGRNRDVIAAHFGLRGLALGARGDVLAYCLNSLLGTYRYLYLDHRTHIITAKGSRYCPMCLADNGGAWLERWRSPLYPVCFEHDVLLERHCPTCGRPPWSTGGWMVRTRESWSCTEAAPGERPRRARTFSCGEDLRTAPTRSATPQQLETARLIESLALSAVRDADESLEVAGVSSDRLDYFTALLELLDERNHGERTVFEVSGDPEVVIEGLGVALRVLDAPDVTSCAAVADSYGLLDPNGSHTPIAGDTRGRARHPLLGAIRLLSVAEHLSPAAQLTFRTGRLRPRYPVSDRRPRHPAEPVAEQIPLAWIPQQLWPGVLAPHIADEDYKARACAAMFLARLGTPRPWQLIAVDLGLPRSFAAYPPALLRRLRATGTWPDFLRSLETLADQLIESPPPIDYSERRWNANDTDLVTKVMHYALEHAPHPGRYDGPTKHLIQVFWELYTGSDLRLAPEPFGLAEHVHPHHQAVRARIGTGHDDLFAAAAIHLAEATTTGSSDIPLWWQPP